MKKEKALNYSDSYKTMDHQHDPKHPKHVDYKDYMKILNLFSEKVFEYLRDTGLPITMPSRLGTFRIVKIKPSNPEKKPVNFKLSKELGKLIRHTNLATDGFYAKLYWNKTDSYMRHKTLWGCTFVRDKKRRSPGSLAEHIKENGISQYITYK
jgi:hypothetical protein